MKIKEYYSIPLGNALCICIYVLDMMVLNWNYFLQEAINVAAKHWGLECLRYEISE